MKTFALILIIAALAVPVLAGDHPATAEHPKTADHPSAGNHPMATESGWFDMTNCEFCKTMLVEPELLHHATWETHKIENGFIYVGTVEPEYAEAMATAGVAMEKLGSDMMTGKVNPMSVKMCGSCAAMGQFMMAGVKMEKIQGEAADVTIVTSDDPKMVAKLHEYADRNTKEMAEMMAMGHESHEDHGHEGHDHKHAH